MTLHCNSNHSQKPIFPNGGCKPPPQSRPELLRALLELLRALLELVPGNHVLSMPCVLAFARFLAFLPHPQEKKVKRKVKSSAFFFCAMVARYSAVQNVFNTISKVLHE